MELPIQSIEASSRQNSAPRGAGGPPSHENVISQFGKSLISSILAKVAELQESKGLGLCLFLGLILWHRSVYYGYTSFFRIAQREKSSFLKRIAIVFLEVDLFSKSFNEYAFLKKNINIARIPSEVAQDYGDDSLLGYGDWNLNKGGGSELQNQQRGLILPLLENSLAEIENHKTILEIGTGNGDVLEYLTEKYPKHNYIGIDFSIKTAEKKHRQRKNLHFLKGYSLDIIQNGSVKADVVFASSTFLFFTPLELQTYILSMKKNGIKQIILNEPSWGGYSQTNCLKVDSKYLEHHCWYHNYCGYLLEGGYNITNFSSCSWNHPVSTRSDIKISLIRADI